VSSSQARLVSIGVPTRNRAAGLRRGLESILSQDYPNLEILISDNASEDRTEDVCRELAATDSRIRYVRHPRNIGLHGNHNFCLDQARGEFVCVFHDHDRHDRRIISRYVAFLDEHPGVGVVCSDWELIDDSDQRIGVRDHAVNTVTPGYEYIEQTIRSGRSSIGIPGTMVRRAALGDARFGHDAPIGFGDFALWCRVAEDADVGHIHERLWSWRQNKESHSARTIESISRDYEINLGGFCDDHLRRYPDHRALVDRWRKAVSRYLFWALAYEVGLHFRRRGSGWQRSERTLFEIMDYRLTPAQFQNALSRMKAHRTGAEQHLVFAAASALIKLRMTWPLAWVTEHQAALRTVLGLK
jgi:glycosyltransferase involved in cell wall biosynthesis